MLPENYKEGAAHEMKPGDVGEDIAEAGRGTDTVVAHLSLGEVVIPRAFLDDPQVLQMLQQIFQVGGADMAEYTVGDPANKINPETGYPEFFGKFFRRIAGAVLPNLGAVGGFTNGLIQGQGLGGAVKQGIGSGLQAAASIYGGPIAGALAGGLNAKLSGGDPLTGAIGGGVGGLLSGGSLSGLVGSLPGTNNLPWLPAGLQGGAVESGSGLLGSIGRATGLSSSSLPSVGGLVGGSGGGSTFGLNNIASVLGGFQNDQSLKKQQDILSQANQQQQTNLDSLRNIDVTQEPGYQFAVKQGNEALNTTLGAQGNLFSGRALQAASDLNQDIATRYYNDAYQREAQRLGAGNQLIGNLGEIRANTLGARSNNLSQTLSQALGGQDNTQELLLRRLYGLGA